MDDDIEKAGDAAVKCVLAMQDMMQFSTLGQGIPDISPEESELVWNAVKTAVKRLLDNYAAIKDASPEIEKVFQAARRDIQPGILSYCGVTGLSAWEIARELARWIISLIGNAGTMGHQQAVVTARLDIKFKQRQLDSKGLSALVSEIRDEKSRTVKSRKAQAKGGQPEEGEQPEEGSAEPIGSDSTTKPRMIVQAWSDFGIGIDTDGAYLGVSPCPERYGVFPRESAVILDLTGKQWKSLLDLLARSKDGNEATKTSVMVDFGYFRASDVPAREDILDAKENLQTKNMLKTANGRLTAAIANLGRNLRKQVEVPTRRGAPAVLSVSDPKEVRTQFVVRHLVRGHDGKLRFGEDPS